MTWLNEFIKEGKLKAEEDFRNFREKAKVIKNIDSGWIGKDPTMWRDYRLAYNKRLKELLKLSPFE